MRRVRIAFVSHSKFNVRLMCYMDSSTTIKGIFLFVLFFLRECFVKCEIQSFLVSPANTEVVAGQTAILNCHVTNQVGTVQWSKDGELLGFDPQIPGYSRYQIVGNASLGIYNLKISDANLEDDADFECQVGPAEGLEAIVGKAHLSVLLQPTSIEIVGQNLGSKVQVEVSNSLSLECEVKGGKPAPGVFWYRNSLKLADTQVKISVSDEEGGRQTVKSTLEINPSPDDDKSQYICEASTSFSSEKLRTFIVLDVLYPPGMPTIEGYRMNEKVRAGETVNIKCLSRGGNPLARLVWTKNGEFLDHSYTTSGWEAINEISFSATASDDRAVYTCSASSKLTAEPLEKSVTLQVLYAPSSVSLKVPKEGKPGDLINASCKTEPSNPASEVTWVVDGRPLTSENVVEENSNGGWVTTSKITINITQQDRSNKMFTCYAVNQELGETVTESQTVSILYAPDHPAIIGYTEGIPINAGKLQRLTCISHGGNPLPELKWFKGDKELSSSQVSTTGTIVSKELTIIAAADDNGIEYHCKSISKALPEPLVSTITLTVYFPPTLPTIKVKPKKPKADSQVRLTCECSSSNPAANITWWRAAEKDEVIDSAAVTVTAAGENKGFSTKSVLTINVTADDDGSKYICQAVNEAIQQNSHDALILSVFYKPIFQITEQSIFKVKENDSTIIDITAKGNPDKITYKWVRANVTLYESSILNITSAVRSQSGTYVCFAKNEIGESSVTVILKVLYPMVIIKDTEDPSEKVIVAEPYSNVPLECKADGYPLTKEFITWKCESCNMQEQTETIAASNGKSILRVKNVTKDISGIFTCHADNGIGSADEWKIILLTKHQPLIKDLDSYKTVTSNRQTSVELQCKAGGVPDVGFSWYLEGVKISEGNSRIKNEVTKLDHYLWKSILTIEDVNAKDFGDYKCVARNEIGFESAEISLLPDSAPDPPVIVKVINITRDSVLLAWVPGFSGGHNQTYRVRYKAIIDPAFSYMDIHPVVTNSVWIRKLIPDVEYEFAMMSFNEKGFSSYTTDKVKAKTLKPSDITYKLNNEEDFSFNASLAELLIGTIGTVFLLLLVFNIILLALYYRKKRPKTRRKGSSDLSISSHVSGSSNAETDETTFSSYTSEPKESEEKTSLYSTYSSYSDQKSASSESSEETDSNEYSEESSDLYDKSYYPSSKFI